jgi:serine phosphatase RsbU (regulator of sigma subunit)
MAVLRRTSTLWIGALLTSGALLAVALLVQTFINYQYVSTNLIRQQARRAGDERVRNVERAARLARPRDTEALQGILDDVRADTGDQVAALAVLQADGTILATSGPSAASLGPDNRKRVLADRDDSFISLRQDGREILVGMLPCRCGLPRPSPTDADPPGATRALLEVALYRDSLSAPFARLRRNAAISASAAFALLVSVSLIALRLRPYVRGKQLEAQADLAREVQRDLLPRAELWPQGVDVAAVCIPASQVGGDFYDVVDFSNGRVAFTIGDVSGHGISAALLMALIHGAMSNPPWGMSEGDAERAAGQLNRLLVAKSSGERFASLFWCGYDPAAGVLSYVNAGHPPPIWIRGTPGETPVVDRLAAGGPVLGLLNDATYHAVPAPVREGDVLVLFSDGIVEAANARGVHFDEERLIAAILAARDHSAQAICDAILTACRLFSGQAEAQDDQTLLVVRLWGAGDRGDVGRERSFPSSLQTH